MSSMSFARGKSTATWSLKEKTKAVIRQFRFFFAIPPMLVIVATFIAVRNYDLARLFWFSLSFIFVGGFLSSVNNTLDAEIDRSSKLMDTQNPVATGELSYREAQTMNLLLPVLSLIAAVLAGPYSVGLPIMAVMLVALYDVKPFRFKDRPLGVLIIPLSQCIPFYFGYTSAASSYVPPPWVVAVIAFLYFNTATVTHHVPDMELDLKLGIRNFVTTYGSEMARRYDMVSVFLAAVVLTISVVVGYLSILGLPLLLLSVARQLRVMHSGARALRDPVVVKKFLSGLLPNSVAVTISILGSMR